jgi:hypothetical protein
LILVILYLPVELGREWFNSLLHSLRWLVTPPPFPYFVPVQSSVLWPQVSAVLLFILVTLTVHEFKICYGLEDTHLRICLHVLHYRRQVHPNRVNETAAEKWSTYVVCYQDTSRVEP